MQMQMAINSGNPLDGNGRFDGNFSDSRQMQQQLNHLLEQLQLGHQPLPGQSGQMQSMSQQLAWLAAQQEAIRNLLHGLSGELKNEGLDTQPLEELQRDMEATELDIVTQNISIITTDLQKLILTRFLEHEKGQLEREQDERR